MKINHRKGGNMPGLIACPSCQNKISERATKCPKCGWGRENCCIVCKKIIMLESSICPECGDPDPFNEQLVSNKGTNNKETRITAISIPDLDNEKEIEKHTKSTHSVSIRSDSGSKQWSIYTKGGKIVAVRNGFCWGAFFFTFGWAFFNKLFLISICYFVSINFLEFMIYDTLGSIDFKFYAVQLKVSYVSLITLEFIARIAFGYSGNKLVSLRLERNGFWKCASLNAKNKQSAIEKYRH